MSDLPAESAGKVKGDGTRIYRLGTPQVIWWVWIAVLALIAGDVLIQGHRGFTLRIAFGALAITGGVWALAMWPRVTAADDGIAVLNPFRRFKIPWGAVRGIYVAEALEVESARRPPKANKTVHSWAVAAPRRSRARASLRGQQWDRAARTPGAPMDRRPGFGIMAGGGLRGRPSNYDALPDEAKAAVKLTAGEAIARELARLSEEVGGNFDVGSIDSDLWSSGRRRGRKAGAEESEDAIAARGEGAEFGATGTGEVMSSGWCWQPIAAILLPVIAFVLTVVLK